MQVRDRTGVREPMWPLAREGVEEAGGWKPPAGDGKPALRAWQVEPSASIRRRARPTKVWRKCSRRLETAGWGWQARAAGLAGGAVGFDPTAGEDCVLFDGLTAKSYGKRSQLAFFQYPLVLWRGRLGGLARLCYNAAIHGTRTLDA